MGGGESRSSEMLRFVEREWEVLREEKGVRVLRNVDSGVEAELLPLMLDPRRNWEKECDIYDYRRTQENALVEVYAVQNAKNPQNSLCGNTQVMRVAVQRTAARYRDLGILSFPEVLYALSESIRGFSSCFNKVGLFQITSAMIAVTSKGAVKVWLNQNFADNHPVDERPQLEMTSASEGKAKASRQELLMLQSLLEVIEQKCQEGHFPEPFRTKIYGNANFLDAYNTIELYCRQSNLDIPCKLPLPSHTSSSASIKIPVSNPPHNFQHRETLIKDLSFSQSLDKQKLFQSPHLKRVQTVPETTYLQPQSPRKTSYIPPSVNFTSYQPSYASQQQSGPIKFNYQLQQPLSATFAPRRL